MNPIEIKFSVKPESFPICDPESPRLKHGDTHFFVSKLTPADEQATQALQDREIIVFNKVPKKAKERHVVPISSNYTSSLSAATNSATLEEHLSIKFFRSLNLSLLMTLIPWNSGCPTALLTTVKQSGKGFAGQAALHSSMQPGLALYADKASMLAMIKKLITDIISGKISFLSQIENGPLTATICIALLNYDLKILTYGLSNPDLKQIVENASSTQDKLNTSLEKKLLSQPKELEICLKEWIEENGEDLKEYEKHLQTLQDTVASLEEKALLFDDGENILAHRYVELSHSAVDIFPQELNMLDENIFEAMARPRLEFLQHLSALGKYTPDKLCEAYINDLKKNLENVNQYLQYVPDSLKTIAKSWKYLENEICNLENLRQRSLQDDDSKAKENFVICYKNYIAEAIKLYKAGEQLVNYASKKNNSFKKDNTFERAKEKLETILRSNPNVSVVLSKYNLSNVNQYGENAVRVASIALESVVKVGSFQKNPNKKEAKKKSFIREITRIEEGNIDKLLQDVHHLRELSKPEINFSTKFNLSPVLSEIRDWLANTLKQAFEELDSELKSQEETVGHLRGLFEQADSNESCLEFMQSLCIYFARSTKKPKTKKLQNAYAQVNLFKELFEKVKNNDKSRFGLLFNTTLHNISLFTDTNLYLYEKVRTKLRGEPNLTASVKDTPADISRFSPFNTNTVKEAINSLEQLGTSKTREEKFVLARLRCAKYLLEAFTSVSENESTPLSLKIKLKTYLKKDLKFSEILKGTFLKDALRLVLPPIGNNAEKNGNSNERKPDYSHENTLRSFILLHELILLDPEALQHFQSAFEQKAEVQEYLKKLLEIDQEVDMIAQGERLQELSQHFSEDVLPVYSSCLENVKLHSIKKYLKDLLLSEIEIDAPPSLRLIARDFMRKDSIDRLAQYTLLSTISRRYETLISRRQIPKFNAVEPGNSETTLYGRVSLNPDKTFEVEFAFLQKIFKAIDNVVSGVQTTAVEFAFLQDTFQAINDVVDETQTDKTQIVIKVNRKELAEKLLLTIEQCANCIIADFANLKTITDLANLKATVIFNFQLHVQAYQKKTINSLLKIKRRPDNADTLI